MPAENPDNRATYPCTILDEDIRVEWGPGDVDVFPLPAEDGMTLIPLRTGDALSVQTKNGRVYVAWVRR